MRCCRSGGLRFEALLLGGDHGQAFAAFGPTPLEHEATRFGFHARTKTMGTFAALVVWLVRTFHDLSLYLKGQLQQDEDE